MFLFLKTFGNLEFSDGLDVLSSFLEDINFDMVSANLNATLDPEFESLFNKSTVLEVDGQKIGIVGYTHEQVNVIAILGKVSLLSYLLRWGSRGTCEQEVKEVEEQEQKQEVG